MDKNLDKFAVIYRLDRTHHAQLYHQTKLLLELYRKVVWSVENDLYVLKSTATDLGSHRIQDLLNYLDLDFEGEMDKGIDAGCLHSSGCNCRVPRRNFRRL